jgi:hypothetical protein
VNAVGNDLLRLLSAQATPGVAPGPSAAESGGALDFAKMLDQARAGQLRSGREVSIAKGAGVQLSDDQLKRISAAADIAEAQGATRALIMIDGIAMKLDVSMRQITGSVDLKSQGVLTGIDAVIHVPDIAEATPGRAPKPIENSSLLDILSRQTTGR